MLTCISAALETLASGRKSQFFDDTHDSQNEEGKSKSLWIEQSLDSVDPGGKSYDTTIW